MRFLLILLLSIGGVVPTSGCAADRSAAPPEAAKGSPKTTESIPVCTGDLVECTRQAAAKGDLAFRLTGRGEIEDRFGQPSEVIETADGGMVGLQLVYSEVSFHLWKMREGSAPYTLSQVVLPDGPLDIGQDRQLVLRNEGDLSKLNDFVGLQDVSLVNLDLREHSELLDAKPFDTLTKWPSAARLPDQFDPEARLALGRNPGLGVRSLHEQGIDGRGIHVAYIDQPLLAEHQDYASRIVRYEMISVDGVPPQMHGAPVASIAVGQSLGVAPGASLTYFATPSWELDNRYYAEALDRVIDINEAATKGEQIRVVGISFGGFGEAKSPEFWEAAVARVREQDILVITCAQDIVNYGMLTREADGDPDDPKSYRRGRRSSPHNALLVPGGNRTLASYRGPDVYWVDPDAGMSWGAPYLVGLAALALQVVPGLDSSTLIEHLLQTAVRTDAGPIVQPVAFLDSVRELSGQ